MNYKKEYGVKASAIINKPLNSAAFFVEMEGVEPSSKQGTPKVSTCLFRCWFSCQARERTP